MLFLETFLFHQDTPSSKAGSNTKKIFSVEDDTEELLKPKITVITTTIIQFSSV